MTCNQTYTGACYTWGIGSGKCPTGYTVKQLDNCTVTHDANGNKLWIPMGGKKSICTRPCSTSSLCCTAGIPPAGQKCDPAYSNLTSICNASMQNFCSKDRMFTNSRCLSWCNNNRAVCEATKGNICADPNNINLPTCRAWCLANPGKCDGAVAKYCQDKKNYGSQYCGCYSSPLNDNTIFKINSSPECFDKVCTSGGAYRRKPGMDIVAGGCPKIITCKQNLDISAIDTSKINMGDISQKCIINEKETKPVDVGGSIGGSGSSSGNWGGGGSTGSGGNWGGGGGGSTGSGGSSSGGIATPPSAVMFIFVFVFIFVVFLAMIMRRRPPPAPTII